MLVSLMFMTTLQFFPKTPWYEPWLGWVLPAFENLPASRWKELLVQAARLDIFWPWYTLLGTAITLGTAWLANRLASRGIRPGAEAAAIHKSRPES